MAMTEFRVGLVFDAMQGKDWMSVAEINKLSGGTHGATNKALLVLYGLGMLEKNGKVEHAKRRYRLIPGFPRPIDKRGRPRDGSEKRIRKTKDGTLGWTYEPITLEVNWPDPVTIRQMGTFTLKSDNVDTRAIPHDQSLSND